MNKIHNLFSFLSFSNESYCSQHCTIMDNGHPAGSTSADCTIRLAFCRNLEYFIPTSSIDRIYVMGQVLSIYAQSASYYTKSILTSHTGLCKCTDTLHLGHGIDGHACIEIVIVNQSEPE